MSDKFRGLSPVSIYIAKNRMNTIKDRNKLRELNSELDFLRCQQATQTADFKCKVNMIRVCILGFLGAALCLLPVIAGVMS